MIPRDYITEWRALFEENLMAKLRDHRFVSDIGPLLAVGQNWNAEDCAAMVMQTLRTLLPERG